MAIKKEKIQPTYLEALHNTSLGWITRAEIKGGYKQWHYKYLELVMQNTDGKNIYISMNAFFSTYRRLEYLKELKALFLDIDCHKIGLTKEQVLMALDEEYLGVNVPRPTFIVDSGRGLYLIWLINKVPSKALPLWNAIQKFFYNELKHLGADRAALDATRILRIPGSINSKSGTEVQVLEYYDYIYDLREIQTNYLPDLIQDKKIKTKGRKKKVLRLFNEYTLHHARLQDLVKLCELRGWDVTGRREYILFLYRYWSCCFLSDKEEALRQTLELNNMFTKPLVENSVKRHTRSAEKAYEAWKTGKTNGKYKRAGYNYTNETLIELFMITLEEQKEMITIISKEEYKRRDRVYQKKKYDKVKAKEKYKNKLKVTGKISKKEQLIVLREKIKDLRLQGLKNKEIMKKLDIKSTTTFERYISYLKKSGLL